MHEHSSDEVALLTFVGEQMGGAISKSVLAEQNANLLEETLEMKRQLRRASLSSAPKAYCNRNTRSLKKKPIYACGTKSRRLRRPMRDLAEAIIWQKT